jgi:hypothetical protein
MSTIKTIWCDAHGTLSYKRVIGTFGVLSLTTSLILTSLKVGVTPPDKIIEAIEYITIASIFGVTAERFSKTKIK